MRILSFARARNVTIDDSFHILFDILINIFFSHAFSLK
jgi:hypothetical protein